MIQRNDGGSYIVAEMDGSVMQDKIAAFRVIPYFARRHINLPDDLQEILDQSEEAINDLIKCVEKDAKEGLEIKDLTNTFHSSTDSCWNPQEWTGFLRVPEDSGRNGPESAGILRNGLESTGMDPESTGMNWNRMEYTREFTTNFGYEHF